MLPGCWAYNIQYDIMIPGSDIIAQRCIMRTPVDTTTIDTFANINLVWQNSPIRIWPLFQSLEFN